MLQQILLLAPFGAFVAVFLPPVAAEVNSGNINLILTVCVVLGLRWPALWTLPLEIQTARGRFESRTSHGAVQDLSGNPH